MTAVKSVDRGAGLASVKVPTTVAPGGTPVLRREGHRGPAVSAASAMTASEAPATVIGVGACRRR